MKHGKNTLEIEVINISKNGFWLIADDEEKFLSFEDFPWFKKASIEDLLDVQEVSPGHFFWEKLDIDLSTEIIDNPERFPLISQ